MLYLSDSEIKNIINDDMDFVENIIKRTFYILENGDFSLGGENKASHGMRMNYTKNNISNLFIAMPGYLGEDFNVTGIKWHGPMRKISRRHSNYTLILNDAINGVPFALMCANTITDYRTAAVSLLAAKTLADKNSKILSIIGPGKINLLLAKGILEYFDIETVQIKGRSEQSILNFQNSLKEINSKLKINIFSEANEACVNADIISINTGFEFKNLNDMPIIKEKYIKNNATLLCSAFSYFSDKIIQNSYKIADYYPMYIEYAKELGYPVYEKLSCIGNRFVDLVNLGKIKKDDIYNLSAIIKENLDFQSKIKIFSSGGIALFDIALGYEIYKIAKSKNIGSELEYE